MASQDHKLKIVVSYRRTDSAMAGRIFDRLALHFGKANLFLDIDNIPFGVDFRKHIEQELATCDLVVAIIGPEWLGPRAGGESRIMNETDPVRVELETALRRDLTIIPVLLDRAPMPLPDQLPEGLKDLAYRNALEVDAGRDFNVHVERLIRAVEQTLGSKLPQGAGGRTAKADKPRRRVSPWLAALGIGGLALVAGGAAFVFFGDDLWQSGRSITTNANVEKECEDLKAILAESGTDFAALRTGEQMEVGGYEEWKASRKITGYKQCRITKYQSPTFICTTPTVDSEIQGEALLDLKTANTEACLGKDWGAIALTDSRGLSNEGTDQSINLALSNAGAGHFVTLMIWQRHGDNETSEAAEATETTGPAPDRPEGFCEDLKSVLDHASTNFDGILGASQKNYWPARLQLAGWYDCGVTELTAGEPKSRYYACDISPFANLSAAKVMIGAISPYVESCLGADWTLRRRISSGGKPVLTFGAGAGQPEIELRPRYSTVYKRWQVLIEVLIRP